MKRPHILLISILTLSTLILLGCTDPTIPDSSEPSGLSAEESAFVELVNEHRESQGLNRLSWFSSLADVALAHSEDMRDRNFFSHTNPDGDGLSDRLAAAGITYQAAAENIAYGHNTGQSVLDG